MNKEIWNRDEPESPCIKLCVVHPTAGLCTGCLRSLDEIAAWSQMSPEIRHQIIAELPNRSLPTPKRRGGRAARVQAPG